MGTTTASKHGLRAAATERRNRHAQRTPLPPRGGVVPVETPDYAEQYGRMTPEQLRVVLRDKFGIKAGSETSQGKLLTAVLNAERKRRNAVVDSPPKEVSSSTSGQMKAGSAAASPKTAPAEDKMDAALPVGSRSAAKAAAVRTVMREHGWSTSLFPAEDTTPEEDVWELTARRGDEALWISWTKGVLTTEPMPSYTVVDRTVKLRNASAVKQYASRPPEAGQAELKRVASNRFFRKRATEPKRLPLPFDPDLATDAEVLAALVGRSVSWRNQYREVEETATVGSTRGRQPIEVRERENGERVISFCCPQAGFRAFALSQLIRVGGPSRRNKRSLAEE